MVRKHLSVMIWLKKNLLFDYVYIHLIKLILSNLLNYKNNIDFINRT